MSIKNNSAAALILAAGLGITLGILIGLKAKEDPDHFKQKVKSLEDWIAKSTNKKRALKDLPANELNEILKEKVQSEEYELAAVLHHELNRRKKKSDDRTDQPAEDPEEENGLNSEEK